MEKIAIIADIHGNMPAFEAVLQDISDRNIKRIFCLGDLVGKGPHPEKAVDLARISCQAVVQGNWDIVMARGEGPPFLNLQWHRGRLGEERLKYLADLPGTIDFYLSGRKVRLFHTSNQGVEERVYDGNPATAMEKMFANTPFTGSRFEPDIVGFADIHHVFSFTRRGKTLFNTGSVGNAVDEPSAAYIILEGNYEDEKKGFFSLQVIRLQYDVDLAVQQARDENMPDVEPYEIELRKARYRGLPKID